MPEQRTAEDYSHRVGTMRRLATALADGGGDAQRIDLFREAACAAVEHDEAALHFIRYGDLPPVFGLRAVAEAALNCIEGRVPDGHAHFWRRSKAGEVYCDICGRRRSFRAEVNL